LHFSGRNTHLLLKEHKRSLLKELEVEQNRTAEQKMNHDFIISKYEATWEHYKVFNLTDLSSAEVKNVGGCIFTPPFLFMLW
jgi:hypothetical protein